jgi:hypothetical protein
MFVSRHQNTRENNYTNTANKPFCGHAESTENEKNDRTNDNQNGKYETWTTGRPWKRMIDGVKGDLKITGISNGIQWPETGRLYRKLKSTTDCSVSEEE